MNFEYAGRFRLFAYSLGMAGWSIMINTISVMLIYFYLPPEGSGLPVLIPQISLFVVFSLFSIVLASGRLIDAITDPLIAWFSDRTLTRWGRRIPFMAMSIIPSMIFCLLLFFPPVNEKSLTNYRWLLIIQSLFYISLTLYIVPFNALMPELAKGKERKLKLSTLLSLMFVLGIIIAAQIPQLASLAAKFFDNPQKCYQYAIIFILSLSVLFMIIPVFAINEMKYCNPVPSRINVFKSLNKTIKNRKFMIFLTADAAFFVTLAIISSGIIYYVKVLLGLPEKTGSQAMAVMIIISLLFYPWVVKLATEIGKKKLIIISFIMFAFIFVAFAVMGKINCNPILHLYFVSLAASFPVAVLGILPYVLVAEMAEEDADKTGEKTEGMYFAVRTFADKLGQTLGVMLFAIFTLFGKDPGNDSGIRMSAYAGCVVCLAAAIVFRRFRE